MDLLQQILVYITLAIAVGYIVKKFFIPSFLTNKKPSKKACGEDGCGCH